jgi:signal transduction histidine kinase
MARWAIALAVSGAGLAVGLVSLGVARDDPGYWFTGRSALGAVALLGAGWALIGCGLVAWLRRPAAFGPLLAAAGLAWFLLEWNNPGIGSPVAFTIGLCLYAACAPLVLHALLVSAGGRVRSLPERAVLALAYGTNVLLLGVLPALVFDPQAEACGECPRNLLLVEGDAELASDFRTFGLWLGVAWAAAAAVLVGRRVPRSSLAGRPVLGAGAAYLALAAAWFAVSLHGDFLAAGTTERRLWLGQAALLALLSLGVAWTWVRARRARAAVAALVVDLAQSPPPGGLRDLLAGVVGDPGLALGYPLDDDGRLVDARGRLLELPAGAERTALVRDGLVVAVLGHRPGLLGDAQLVEEVAASARLALDNERLQAEVRARLEDLRASRARIVEAGDAERKRLERDLHDGAQQRLVALSLSLRLLRSQQPELAVLERADAELRSAIEELRDLAHGLYPAVLADEGLGAAVEALAEESRVPVRVGALPGERFAPALESAAYTVVAESARAATGGLVVRAGCTGPTLAVELEAPGFDGLDLVALEDRLGSLDGRLAVSNGDGRVTIRAELPCGS